ncbi:MAG: hypothetical protein N2C14_33140 [Planctomycetales bacterium]
MSILKDRQVWVQRLSWMIGGVMLAAVLATGGGLGPGLALVWFGLAIFLFGAWIVNVVSAHERFRQGKLWREGKVGLSGQWLLIGPGWPRFSIGSMLICSVFAAGLFAVCRELTRQGHQEDAGALGTFTGLHLIIVLSAAAAVLLICTPSHARGGRISPTFIGALGGAAGAVTAVGGFFGSILAYVYFSGQWKPHMAYGLYESIVLGGGCFAVWGAFVGGPVGFAIVSWTRQECLRRICKEGWSFEDFEEGGIYFLEETAFPAPGNDPEITILSENLPDDAADETKNRQPEITILSENLSDDATKSESENLPDDAAASESADGIHFVE